MIRLAIWSSIAGAQEDDPLLEQQREDVVGALAAVRLLDDHRDDLIDRPVQLRRRQGERGCHVLAHLGRRATRARAPGDTRG